jgi:hypothetical protein
MLRIERSTISTIVLDRGNIEMSSMFRPLADGKFEPKVANTLYN